MYYNFYGSVVQEGRSPDNWASGRPVAHAKVTGTAKGDQLVDVAGGNVLVGLGGDDRYQVVDSKTQIVERAGEGNDTVLSWVSYKLSDNVETLHLYTNLTSGVAASTGSLVVSHASRVNLVSGTGDDVLADESKDAQNIFVFNKDSGDDAVYGFTATGENRDLIRLNDPAFSSFSAVQAAMTQVGADVRISFSKDDAVLIRNVKTSDLSAANFLLPFSPDQLKLTFADEFDSVSLWNAQTGQGTWKTSYTYGPSDGWNSFNSRNFTGELEIYVDPTYAGDPAKSTKPLGLNPFATHDGVLSITATKLSDDLSAKLYGMHYASGVLTTEKTFAQTYGYFEIRAEVPMVKGMFPAFWLLPTSRAWKREIDVMENVGQDYVSGGSICGETKNAFYTAFPDGLSGMHKYGVLWTAETITWYVDGQAIGSIPTPADMHQDMYMIVNLAVGTDWAGTPDPNFTSASFNVDYVHAYRLGDVKPGQNSPVGYPHRRCD